MKTRFSSLDLGAITKELQTSIVGHRLSNVYDINPKVFLFKFTLPDEEFKPLLLVESGTRIHLTKYVRDKNKDPSNFNAKLRKHLKTKRLKSVLQLDMDRRIMMTFGEGEFAFHLILEFFALGNIILLDNNFKIMSTLRVVDLEEGAIKVGEIYHVSEVQAKLVTITAESLSAALQPETPPAEEDTPKEEKEIKGFSKRKSKKKASTLKNVLRANLGKIYGPSLVDHAIASANLNPSLSDFTHMVVGDSNDEFQALLQAFQECDNLILRHKDTGAQNHGYIISNLIDSVKTFDEFHPFKPAYFDPNTQILDKFNSINEAVDDFFSKIEGQKLEQKTKQAERHAEKKLQAVRDSSNNLIKKYMSFVNFSFQLSQEKKEKCARAIEQNIWLVDSCIKTVCSYVAAGMDWKELSDLITEEQDNGNEVALSIKELKLETGTVVMTLPDPDEEENDDEEITTPPNVVVEIDIYNSAYGNATSYYGEKKKAVSKEQKTIIASKRAVEIAEQKINKTLEKNSEKVATIKVFRIPYWFEKFLWFISSGARDAQQAEALGTKFIAPGDFYVNSDTDGSTMVIVKPLDNRQSNATPSIPSTTLLQASSMSICQSKAWESKNIVSSWWTFSENITKQFNGSTLPVGTFTLHPNVEKNYLLPSQLVYGVALMFEVAEENVQAHYLDRRPWARDGHSEVFKEGESKENVENKGEIEVANDNDDGIERTIEVEEELENPEEILESDERNEIVNENDEEKVELHEEEPDSNEVKSEVRENENMENDNEDTAKVSSVSLDSLSISNRKSESVKSKTAKPTPIGRGKKSKLQKMKTKYANQDEDDRIQALERLGSAKPEAPKSKKAKALAKRQEIHEEKVQLEQKKRTDTPQRARPPKQATTSDYVVPEVNLDSLTGIPSPGDELLHCIPVCGPWSVLQKYKFSLKLIPGSLKRGKGAKSAEGLFISMATKNKNDKELELIKKVTDQEWINSMLAKVKISATEKK